MSYDQPDGAAPPVGSLTQQVRTIAGREVVCDADGYLLDAAQWTEEMALDFARECGLAAPTDAHWQVIRFLRDYYLQNGRAPLHRQLKAGTGLSLMEIEGLFPGGLRHGARRWAGLPNPRSCGM